MYGVFWKFMRPILDIILSAKQTTDAVIENIEYRTQRNKVRGYGVGPVP